MKKVFGSWVVSLVILLGLSSVGVIAEATSANTSPSTYDLQSIFEANEILLNEMTEEMHQLLIQIEGIGLPAIDLPLGIQISTFDLLRGFMNGINIPLLVNIGGIGRLNGALFNDFTYSSLLSGSLRFPDGILNESNPVNNSRLPQQSLEARIAAQEYLLYVTDAIRGALRLILLMDTDEGIHIDITDILAGARSFLAFNMNDLNQRRDAMYNHFGNETVTMGVFRSITRDVSDVVRSVDGEGCNLLINVRNFLLGSQENVDILVEVLEYAERIATGEITEKYSYIDFEDTSAGVDQMLGYLIVDIAEARHVLAQFDRLTEPFTTLLNQEEGGIVALIFSQLPDSLAFVADDLFEDVNDLQDILDYLDSVKLVLGQVRLSVREIDLNQGARFITEILSGEILDKYLAVQHTNSLQIGTLLRYLRDDLDGAIAALEIVELIDQEFSVLLRGRRLSDLIKESIIITVAEIINTVFDDAAGLGGLGLGEMIIEMFESTVLNFNIPETMDNLRQTTDALLYLISVFDQIELYLIQRLSLR